MLSAKEPHAPHGLEIVHRLRGIQMVHTRPVYDVCPYDVTILGGDDSLDMLALAKLTKPVPFERQTHMLGEFIGVRVDGKLVAMAGQRMAFPGCTEISAVCVHPDHQGRGYARALVTVMTRRLERCGITPFLHIYIENEKAIGLYQHLGFDIRCQITIAKLA
ncbi:MAG: GNAT family N-acetyltransferase [Pseudomonadota bacterium]